MSGTFMGSRRDRNESRMYSSHIDTSPPMIIWCVRLKLVILCLRPFYYQEEKRETSLLTFCVIVVRRRGFEGSCDPSGKKYFTTVEPLGR